MLPSCSKPALAAASGSSGRTDSRLFLSVLLTQLYLSGALRFSSALAGLCSATGVGLVTLLRTSRSLRQTLLVLGMLWGIGSASGLLLAMLGI